MNVGKIVQEQFWRQSSPFTEFSSSSSPLGASIVSLILLEIGIEGEVNLKSNSIHTVINNFKNYLLISELNGSFTLKINGFVYLHNKDVDEHMKGFYKDTLNKK